MGRFAKKSTEHKIKIELKDKFLESQRFTVDELVDEYYKPNSPYSFLLARRKIHAVLGSIKEDYLKEGIAFGALNDMNEWGLPSIKEEYEYMGIFRYKLWKGILTNSRILINNGRRKGLLTRTESGSMEVPLLTDVKQESSN